ncbi:MULTISPECIES: DUF6318 family protein [unclassified Arthrobacter]|uniref:DUF6318 family protein n=1 Tax=unclassified Arthrobacter TaxID=235627 RepID=UPI001C852F4C|nr:DUF6318 family protein [Arthrobacter sp. MAHUQ-56]MBX7445753.1 hypothetical protein [Arthrobacter sp. MAHUQ-56]
MTSQNLFAPLAVRSTAGAVLVAGALVLAGCAGGAPADPGATSQAATEAATPSASATPTPTPSAAYKPADASGPAQNVPVPVLPEVAKTETKEGAEAFTKYWYETLSYAYETGNSRKLENVSGPGCVFCKGLKDGIDEAWSEGRWISGGTIQTPAITATVESGAQAHAEVQVIQATIEIRRPDGSLLQEPTPATNTGSRAGLTFGPTGWVMTDLGLIR